MSRGLLWLALADLGQAWLRSGLAALAIAAAILAVAFFAGQIQLHQSEVLASYEAAGAATFVVQLTGVGNDEIDGCSRRSRRGKSQPRASSYRPQSSTRRNCGRTTQTCLHGGSAARCGFAWREPHRTLRLDILSRRQGHAGRERL